MTYIRENDDVKGVGMATDLLRPTIPVVACSRPTRASPVSESALADAHCLTLSRG